ncbi:MAG TPA: AAA family ATPase [Gammaproteobacteria bacterium]|nr:AAA family ATPase [Gammaproteobacteria bacterium]
MIHSHEGLKDTGDTLSELTSEAIIQALSIILALPLDAVRKSLSADGMLAQSGLLRLSRGGPEYLRNKLELLGGLVDVIYEPQKDCLAMLSGHFHPAHSSTLQLDDFDYIRRDIDAMTTYLGTVCQRGKAGVNILIYGEPGTGKSELARTLAAAVKWPLFEVNMADEDGDALCSDQRFSAYRLSQQVLRRQANALILFDEIEDVFNDHVKRFFGILRAPERRKAWVNRLLENNPVPAIWIRKVAENPAVAPALVSRAAHVATVVGDGTQAATEQQMERLLEYTLKAMGNNGKLIETRDPLIPYRLDVLNTDRDICALATGLQRHPRGRLCLYGPPGTGKTAFGRYAADVLDKPLLVKRASDLLSPFIGMTEQYLADMFTQAQEDDAVLLLDEADSFLTDRQGARYSWEVTQVNELLTQMESFEGLFIC